ncbi:hypothetical protein ACGFS9_02895 [Streptomyces sp. NPDC048566]|uniref:hypothetical protein n=1 Tax=Streptomyces sp. NPDC048566 TaxID=3365569 RepID=UPI0037198A21
MGWLLWLSSVWAAWLMFVFVDAPTLLGRAANLLRQQHIPHWARHGHAPPPSDPAPRGRHIRKVSAR